MSAVAARQARTGRRRQDHRHGYGGTWRKDAAQVIPDVKKTTLRDVVLDNVEPGSIVSTDELMSYGLLTGDGYKHGMVKHGAKEWSYYDYRHDAAHNTNRVESFWRLFKKSVASTHIHISAKYADRTLTSSLSGRTIAQWGTRCLIF